MGATGWDYFVPYQADISAALQRLREDVFARGDYELGDEFSKEEMENIVEQVRPELDPWIEKCREMAAGLPEDLREMYMANAEKFKRELLQAPEKVSKPKRKPKTIKEALKRGAESGTHSILDIECISDTREFGAITPFPQARLMEFFGTETPTHAQIMEVYESGALKEFICERWEGIYIVSYRDGVPDEFFLPDALGIEL